MIGVLVAALIALGVGLFSTVSRGHDVETQNQTLHQEVIELRQHQIPKIISVQDVSVKNLEEVSS